MRFVWRLLINAAAVWVAAYVVPGVTIDDNDVGELFLIALILGLVNAFIRPVIMVLTLPLTIITLGLFTIVVNAFTVVITAWISPGFSLEGSQQFLTAILASLVISVVSIVLSWVLPDGK